MLYIYIHKQHILNKNKNKTQITYGKALNSFIIHRLYYVMFKGKCRQPGENAVTKMPVAAFCNTGIFTHIIRSNVPNQIKLDYSAPYLAS